MGSAQAANIASIRKTMYSGINSGQYFVGQNTVHQNVDINYTSSPGDFKGIDILLGASESDAAVDAEARAYSPRCFPGTREQYVEDITKWASTSNGNQSPSIYCMFGPAGVGKSAIAQTCAESVKRSGHLGATFFFSVNTQYDHTRFFTTIAYQLSTVLPEYKRVLNDVVLNDKTIIKKTIASQFNTLIVGPLRKLKGIPRKTVFIDGLDECRSTDAQSQIIELIASSVRDGTTPFRWAFFSRLETHIETTFTLAHIHPLCNSILLPISRDIDEEIRLYLEGGFKNILGRKSLTSPLPWPPAEAIQMLVDASAGLYAYPAAVLRFIGTFRSGGPKEALATVLDVISRPSSRAGSFSPFAELDAFYMLIMRQIPDHILPSVQLLFACITGPETHPDASFNIAAIFNRLHLSEAMLNDMRKHLHAVLYFRDPPGTLRLGTDIDVTRPYFEQRIPSQREHQAIYLSLGRFAFHHKSFYDFIIDPSRSATFCATTPEMKLKLFEKYLQNHSVLAQSYVVRGIDFVLMAGMPDSASVLSFPLENEFCSSYAVDRAFRLTGPATFWDNPGFLQNIPAHILQKLSKADFRKYVLVSLRVSPGTISQGHLIEVQPCFKSVFHRLNPGNAQSFNFTVFLSMIKLLKQHKIIERYHLTLTSRMKCFFQAKHPGERSGLYILGKGDNSVYWYWELNMDTKEFYEFRTLDLSKAMEIFQSYKYKMWDQDWTPPSP